MRMKPQIPDETERSPSLSDGELVQAARRGDKRAFVEIVARHEARVRAALARLPETYRLPLILYYREGQSVRAAAEVIGISEDAMKQRLARGREMLREQMTGKIETVLTRTAPNAIFTMAIAAAIGALAAPAAVAGSVFAAASASGASTAATSSTSMLTAMSTSKAFLVATAIVATICVPIGYRIHSGTAPQVTNSGPE